MRFADLKPSAAQAPGCPITLTFTCPACGPPYIVNIPVILNGEGANAGREGIAKWQVTCPDLSWDRTTITPSINISPCGHGRKRPCNWHGSIINGEVIQ